MALRTSQEGILVDAQPNPGLEVYQEGIIVDAEPPHEIKASHAGVTVSWSPGEPREQDVSHAGTSALWNLQNQYLRTSHGGVSPLWKMDTQNIRVPHAGISVFWQTQGYIMLRFSTLGHENAAPALNVPGVTFDASGNLNVNLNLYVDGTLLQMLEVMLKSTYDTNDDGKVNSADDADALGGTPAANYLTKTEHTALGDDSPHHARYTDIEAQAVADTQIATHVADADAHPIFVPKSNTGWPGKWDIWGCVELDDTSLTVLPAGSVTVMLWASWVISVSDEGTNADAQGNTVGGAVVLHDAISKFELNIGGDGAVTVVRTSGSATADVMLWLLWI